MYSAVLGLMARYEEAHSAGLKTFLRRRVVYRLDFAVPIRAVRCRSGPRRTSPVGASRPVLSRGRRARPGQDATPTPRSSRIRSRSGLSLSRGDTRPLSVEAVPSLSKSLVVGTGGGTVLPRTRARFDRSRGRGSVRSSTRCRGTTQAVAPTALIAAVDAIDRALGAVHTAPADVACALEAVRSHERERSTCSSAAYRSAPMLLPVLLRSRGMPMIALRR